MRTAIYMIVSNHGDVRVTKRYPQLRASEVAIFLHVDIPDTAFDRILATTDLNIPEHVTITPTVLFEQPVTPEVEETDEYETDEQGQLPE